MVLEVLSSDILADTRHGFFTRKGGASAGIYEGLNCGAGSNDQQEIVAINRTYVAKHINVAITDLSSVHQFHSNIVAAINGPATGPRPKADAMVTKTRGVALGILTADCAPVLFSDPDAGVVGAAHAGWKGAISGVLEETVDAMVRLGADRTNISATVGPCISQRAYEVGPEFFENFQAENPDYDRFFDQGTGDRMQFDLPGFCLHRLRSTDVLRTDWTGHCTFSDPDRFYSFRRTTHAKEADYGRLISVIRA